MTKIESRFSELWQAEHEGKQIPIVKKSENEKMAYEWFCKGIEYVSSSMSISEKTPMTVEQAANFTGFSKAYIYKLIGAGKIPSYKPDSSRQGKVILCKEELQNFLFANKRASNEELREKAVAILAGGTK